MQPPSTAPDPRRRHHCAPPPPDTIDNPYWDALRTATTIPVDATGLDWTAVAPAAALARYREFCAFRYARTISDPATVAFVTDHANGRVIDPLAGNGFWAYLLHQAGIDVTATDLHPSRHTYHPVAAADPADAVAGASDRSLLLSWPPYRRSVGVRALRAYRGGRVIYLGEGFGGCCATTAMFDLLRDEWTEIAAHTPIRWPGVRDHVTVFTRPGATTAADTPRTVTAA